MGTYHEARSEKAKAILESVQAVLTNGHFVYTSGKHGSQYINKDALYPHTLKTETLCQMMAEDAVHDGIEAVVGPAYGGIILANNVARALNSFTQPDVLGIYAEKDSDGFALKRGYDKLVSGRRILIVEDILNTGGSVEKVVELCQQTGAEVVGVSALVNRGGVRPEDIGGVPLRALLDIEMEAVDAKDCQLCIARIPVNQQIGKGAEFLRSRLAR